jgi:hypothetical protein
MTRCCDKRVSTEELYMRNLVQLVTLCPDGRDLSVHTQSEWLVGEWDKMCQWKDHNYEGLEDSDVSSVWHQIMKQLDTQDKRLLIEYGAGEEKPRFSEAAKIY